MQFELGGLGEWGSVGDGPDAAARRFRDTRRVELDGGRSDVSPREARARVIARVMARSTSQGPSESRSQSQIQSQSQSQNQSENQSRKNPPR